MEKRLKVEDQRPFLLIDVSNIVYRKYHAVKKIYGEDFDRGRVFYFFFSELVKMKEVFKKGNLVFCFDSDTSVRKRMQKKYKPEKEDNFDKRKVERIISSLKTKILPAMGFKTILKFKDLEADDVIGATVKGTRGVGKFFVIGSNDKDFYQLLKKNVVIYDSGNREIITDKIFKERYNDLPPKDWAMVKALIGKKNEVDGIEGIGIKTAIKFLTGGKVSEKNKQKIADNEEKISKMLMLSTLPILPVKRRFKLRNNELTEKKIKFGLKKSKALNFFDNNYLKYSIEKLLEGERRGR